MIVLVGSTRPAKVEAVREALTRIAELDPRFSQATIEPRDLSDRAPRMPMSLDEVIDGARLRADLLLGGRAPDAASEPRSRPTDQTTSRFAVGLEGGLHRVDASGGLWLLQSWAAVTDGQRWGFGGGPSLAIPSELAERVRAGAELGDVIDAFAGAAVRGTRGAWGVLTRDVIGRQDAFRLAVLAAFAPFYNTSLRSL